MQNMVNVANATTGNISNINIFAVRKFHVHFYIFFAVYDVPSENRGANKFLCTTS